MADSHIDSSNVDPNLPDAAIVPPGKSEEVSFAETAMKLGGKSDEEARRTGAVDTADDQVEALFAPQYQTINSPAHRAVWDRGVPVAEFVGSPPKTPVPLRQTMDGCLQVVRSHVEANTLLDENKKITSEVMNELGDAGYWGLLVDRDYGGSGAPFLSFASFLTEMATVDPTIAGLASVHGCIGAVDPVRTFGSAEQKKRFLPGLADGSRLSAFALTEPGAGSDLTALRTTARLEGDHYLVNGEKLFITNVVPGRTIGLVCRIEGRPSVLIAELPPEENDQFRLTKYGLWALKHTYNQGMVFRDFAVPAQNLLEPSRGDGLTIAYHGLNLGRVALCANAAGTMRLMLASMIPWAQFRKTYGQPIARRELVQRRMGELAGLITACDGLVEWCAGLIDRGYRGEMECIIAKIFGSESQKHAAIEYFMKTHGGRSFLHGHSFGDHVHEYLAPCIYEGEGEMLAMGFFKSLVKHHGKTFFEPIGKALSAAGISKPNPLNPAHAWALKGVVLPYAKWMAARRLLPAAAAELPDMPAPLQNHAEYACEKLTKMAVEVSSTMSSFQLSLTDRQCRMAELSLRCQDLITILCTSLYASRHDEEMFREAGDISCQVLTNKLEGKRPTNRYYRQVTELGGAIADGAFPGLSDLMQEEIHMGYKDEA